MSTTHRIVDHFRGHQRGCQIVNADRFVLAIDALGEKRHHCLQKLQLDTQKPIKILKNSSTRIACHF